MRLGFMLLTLLLSMSFICQASVPDTQEYVTASDQSTLTAWLVSHPEYRIAADRDCNCEADIQSIRKGSGGVWKPNPSYHPYYVRGDFNGDKNTDFAVILVNAKENGKRYLAIFNGPYKAGSNPVYLSPAEGALFYGPPRPNPYRLIVGDFGTEGAAWSQKGMGMSWLGTTVIKEASLRLDSDAPKKARQARVGRKREGNGPSDIVESVRLVGRHLGVCCPEWRSS